MTTPPWYLEKVMVYYYTNTPHVQCTTTLQLTWTTTFVKNHYGWHEPIYLTNRQDGTSWFVNTNHHFDHHMARTITSDNSTCIRPITGALVMHPLLYTSSRDPLQMSKATPPPRVIWPLHLRSSIHQHSSSSNNSYSNSYNNNCNSNYNSNCSSNSSSLNKFTSVPRRATTIRIDLTAAVIAPAGPALESGQCRNDPHLQSGRGIPALQLLQMQLQPRLLLLLHPITEKEDMTESHKEETPPLAVVRDKEEEEIRSLDLTWKMTTLLVQLRVADVPPSAVHRTTCLSQPRQHCRQLLLDPKPSSYNAPTLPWTSRQRAAANQVHMRLILWFYVMNYMLLFFLFFWERFIKLKIYDWHISYLQNAMAFVMKCIIVEEHV